MQRALLFWLFVLLGSPAYAAGPNFTANNLADALNAACQQCVASVSIGSISDKSTWRIDFVPGATTTQQQQAQTAMASFDPAAPTADETRLGSYSGDPSTCTDLSPTSACVAAAEQRLKTMSLSQLSTWYQNNVTTAAKAQQVELLLLAILAHQLRMQ